MTWDSRASVPLRALRRRKRDLGRLFAQLLCVFFALLGAVPLSGSLVLRSEPVKKWAAAETSRLLREHLGVEATFSVELSFIPLRLAVTNLKVPSTDDQGPALTTRLAAVSPRFFSLLAGRIDVGDIELEDSTIRLVMSNGRVQNVAYDFPQTRSGEPPELERSPFRSLSISGATVDLTTEEIHVETGRVDVDVLSEPDLAFDVALRVSGADIDRKRAAPCARSARIRLPRQARFAPLFAPRRSRQRSESRHPPYLRKEGSLAARRPPVAG